MLRDITCRFKVSIPPSLEIQPGIKHYLGKFIQRHVAPLNGVVLSFKHTKILDSSAQIMYEKPFSHILIETTFTVFCPAIGQLLDGIVNKTSSDHIGLLIYGVFNASIPSNQLRRREFIYDSQLFHWTFQDHIIQPGSVIRFSVKEINVVHDLISVIGTLLKNPTETGLLDIMAPTHLIPQTLEHEVYENIEEREEEDRISIKRKEREMDSSESDPIEQVSKRMMSISSSPIHEGSSPIHLSSPIVIKDMDELVKEEDVKEDVKREKKAKKEKSKKEKKIKV